MIKHWTVYFYSSIVGGFVYQKRVDTYDKGLTFIANETGQDKHKLFNESVQLPDGSIEVKTPISVYQLVPTKETN